MSSTPDVTAIVQSLLKHHTRLQTPDEDGQLLYKYYRVMLSAWLRLHDVSKTKSAKYLKMSDAYKYLAVSNKNMTVKHINVLIVRGFFERLADERDKRVVRLRPTQKFHDFMDNEIKDILSLRL